MKDQMLVCPICNMGICIPTSWSNLIDLKDGGIPISPSCLHGILLIDRPNDPLPADASTLDRQFCWYDRDSLMLDISPAWAKN